MRLQEIPKKMTDTPNMELSNRNAEVYSDVAELKAGDKLGWGRDVVIVKGFGKDKVYLEYPGERYYSLDIHELSTLIGMGNYIKLPS